MNGNKKKQARKPWSKLDVLLTFIHAIPEAAIFIDKEGKILFANEHFARRRGKKLEELIGTCLYDYFSKDVAERRRSYYEEALRSGKVVYFEDESALGMYESFAYPVFDKKGNTIGVAILAFNISERKRMEKELAQSEKRYRSLVENAAEGIVVIQDDVIKFANSSVMELTGYAIEKLTEKPFLSFVHPKDRDRVRRDLSRVLRYALRPFPYVFRILKDSGEIIWVEAHSAIIEWEGREAILTFLMDVTRRKEAEDALISERNQLLSIFDSIEQVIYVSDPNTYEILFVNRYLKSMLGKDPTGGLCYKEFQGLEKPCEFCTNEIILKAPYEPYRWEYHNPLVNRDYDITDRIIRWPDGRHVRFEVAIDITEHKKAEEEVAALQNQLFQAQKLEAVGRLAGGIAHDFNNLLTVIKGACELSLFELKEDSYIKRRIEEIQKAAERAAELTRHLLAYSRRQIMELKIVDLNMLIRNMETVLRRMLGEDIELVTFLQDRLYRVKVDPAQIEQVIMNLAVNARDAMPEGGKLTIETANVELDEEYAKTHAGTTPGPYALLSISDTGYGIKKEFMDRIFEPFFTTKEMGRGTGLGLSIVYGIVKQSGGNIWVYSEEGKGTTFKIYLPSAEEKEGVSKSIVEKKDIPKGEETILVVEDDEMVSKLTVEMLKKLGYKVFEVKSKEEASKFCRDYKEPINLIFCDVVMPGVSGPKLVEELIRYHPESKTLFMSGYTENVIVHHGVLKKGINFIQKPFTIVTLAKKVREVLK